ncbi:MAG TPA: glycosyltransferase [Terriglobales bacterium]|nr:glycosyltransferase [Terriglobales bacterium]
MSVPVLQPVHEQVIHGRTAARRIRVAYVINSMRDGGAERQLLELFRLHDRDRFALSLILMDNLNSERARGLVDDVFIMGIPFDGNSNWLPRSMTYLTAIRRTHAYLRKWRPDIVHAQLPAPCILGGLAAAFASVPVFIRSPRCMLSLYRSRTRMGAWLDEMFLRSGDFAIGNSEAVSRELMTVAGCAPQKCVTIHNGVDVERFHPSLPRFWRDSVGWTDEEFVFGTVGNFSAAKRHCDFVTAASLIAKEYQQARFVLLGADYGLRASLESQIAELGLQNKFLVLDSDPAPEKIFAAMDVYICSSESEGFSNVVLEAMACGKPVIATHVGGNPEAVEDGRTGFLVPPRAPEAIANAAGRLIANPEFGAELGRNARERAVKRFSLQRMVTEHERLYLRLLKEKGRAA